MSGAAGRAALGLIRVSCRRLADGDERCREWSAEVAAIVREPGRWRGVRAVRFAAGTMTGARRMRLAPADGTPGSAAARLVTGLVLYAGVLTAFLVTVGHPGPGHRLPWPFIVIVAGVLAFALFCLLDLARARQVRYLPKWAWALICVVQIPLGGIFYLSLGRVRSTGEVR
jgi:hypothetical protein